MPLRLCHVSRPVVAFLVLAWALNVNAADSNWPRWRGPHGDGHSDETGLPVGWNAKSVIWQTTLKGSGQSTPMIWGDRIFLTTALESGKTRLVICLDRKKGNVIWEKVAWSGEPEKTHAQNGWATPSCVTDGERVVAFFGRGGLHCYDMDGKVLWEKDLGLFPGMWGTAASPVIVGDLVIQNCDAENLGLLMAFNKNDGKEVWKTPRTPPERGGWTTPVLTKAGDKQELVLNGEKGVTAYNPVSGEQLWSCKSFAGRGDPTVTPGNGMLFVINGQPGDIYAIRPGGNGDVTNTRMAWHTPRKSGRDQPSPILVGNYLLVTSMTGITTCYDSRTGKVLWEERLKGVFSSSPIAADGLIYIQNEAGDTTVIKPGPTLEVMAQNPLAAKGEIFRAALAPSAGQIFARSDKKLYCIGKANGK